MNEWANNEELQLSVLCLPPIPLLSFHHGQDATACHLTIHKVVGLLRFLFVSFTKLHLLQSKKEVSQREVLKLALFVIDITLLQEIIRVKNCIFMDSPRFRGSEDCLPRYFSQNVSNVKYNE